jgi:hypothetical protein
MKPRLIVIDGKTYNSVNEMPPDVRANYEQAMQKSQNENGTNIPEDRDKHGSPDIFENMPAANILSAGMKFIVDGKEYNGIEDLPPEARAKYEQAMGALDKNRNGMPDFLEGMMNMTSQATPNVQSAPMMTNPRPASYKPMSVSPTITPDTSNGWMLALAGVFILGLCALGAIGVWYFFIR